MIIRQANYKDISRLAEIFDLYRQFYGQRSDIHGAKTFLQNRMEHMQSILFIAETGENDSFAGFTQLYPVFSSISLQRSYILNDLYVREEYRKNGIAKLLIGEAKKFTISNLGKGLELSTAEHNEQARSLYEKEGFVKESEFLTYFWKAVL